MKESIPTKAINRRLNLFISIFVMIFTLSLTLPTHATVYTTVKDGNWNAASTWLNNNKPSSGTINSSHTINIKHTVNYPNKNLELYGTININPQGGSSTAKLIIPNGKNFENYGDLNIIGGSLVNYRFTSQGNSGNSQSGNFINKGGNVYIEDGYAEYAQNWQSEEENQGIVRVINSCILVGENFQVKSDDIYEGAYISMGWHGSGNFQFNSGHLTLSNTSFELAGSSGDFQLSSGITTGDIGIVQLKNSHTGSTGGGKIEKTNSGNVSLAKYCSDDQPTGFTGSKIKDCNDNTFPADCEPGVNLTGPTAVDDSETTQMNTPVTISALSNDIEGDASLDPGSVTLQNGTEPNPNTEGTFTVQNNGQVLFTPVDGFTGTVTVDYEVCDLNNLCDIATITVVIEPVDGPIAIDDSETTQMNTPVTIDVDANDQKGFFNLDPSTVTIIGNQVGGTFVPDGNGNVVFTPTNNFTGTAYTDYRICDVAGLCDEARITVTIPNTVTGPTAVDDSEVTQKNTPVTIDVDANDTPGSSPLVPGSVIIIGAQNGGTFVPDGNGNVVFTPNNNFTGTATANYKICDQNNLCDEAQITVFIPDGNDTDGDGCTDDVDEYPEDPDRCYDIFYPADGDGTLAYEDLWPGKGDYDFNDLVIDYQFKTVMNGDNKIVETFGTFTIQAFGANFHNGFGFQLADYVIQASHITVSGYDLKEDYISLASNGLENNQNKPTVILYDNAYKQMAYPGTGIGVNTTVGAPYVAPKTLNLLMTYQKNTYTYDQLKLPQFNPFIIVDMDRGVEVHLPDYEPTALADQNLFQTQDDDSNPSTGRYYKTENHLPWAIHITESFDYPVEKVQIPLAYGHFVEWAESMGVSFADWYRLVNENKTDYRTKINIYKYNR